MPTFTVVASEAAFVQALEAYCTPSEVFDAQGEEHGAIDLRLVRAIEAYVQPRLGRWEDTGRWWHQMDYYGDGIRSLAFARADFTPELVRGLHALLIGEHEAFCVLCQVYERMDSGDDDKEKIGSMAIYRQRILITQSLARSLAVA